MVKQSLKSMQMSAFTKLTQKLGSNKGCKHATNQK